MAEAANTTHDNAKVDSKFTYGEGETAITIPVASDILLQFQTIHDMHQHCTNPNTEIVDGFSPIINDALDQPICISETELLQFFKLFSEIHSQSDEDTTAVLDEFGIQQDVLKKYLMLANLLHNDHYIDSLCRYAAFLIRQNRFSFD
jgi:hypothetical protein